jgi:hypothetical protein
VLLRNSAQKGPQRRVYPALSFPAAASSSARAPLPFLSFFLVLPVYKAPVADGFMLRVVAMTQCAAVFFAGQDACGKCKLN